MSGLDPFPTGQVSLLAQQKNPLVPDYPTGLFSSPVSVAKPRGARGNDPTIIHKEGESQERENFLGVARTWSIVRQVNSYAITPGNPTLSTEISDSRKIHVRRKNRQMY